MVLRLSGPGLVYCHPSEGTDLFCLGHWPMTFLYEDAASSWACPIYKGNACLGQKPERAATRANFFELPKRQQARPAKKKKKRGQESILL